MKKLLVPLMLFAFQTNPALALVNELGNPDSVDENALSAAEVGCENFCKSIEIDLSTWTTSDDQWCANHGSQTETSSPAQNNLNYLNTPEAQNCPYPMLAGDRSCRDVKEKLWKCKFKNSNVAAQCIAYRAYEEHGRVAKGTAILEVAAATTCGAACAAQFLPIGGAALQAACRIAGTTAGSAEIASILFFDGEGGSDFEKACRAFGAAAGGAASFNLKDAKGSVSAKTHSCIAAGIFAVLAGLRNKSIQGNKEYREQACQNIQSLASSALTTGNIGQTSSGSGGFSFSTAQGGGLGNAIPNSPAPIGSPSATDLINNLTVDGATFEGKLLADSGMLDSLKENASSLPIDEIAKAVESGDMASAFSAMGNHSISGNLAELASTASKDSDTVLSLLPDGGNLFAGASSLATYRSKSSGPSLLGLGSEGKSFVSYGTRTDRSVASATRNTPKEVQFETAEDPSDIWHRGTKRSLFEIVSGRIEKVAPDLKRHKKIPMGY